MSRNEEETLELYLHAETAKAIMVGEDERNDHQDNVWLPKSQIEYEIVRRAGNKSIVEVTAPEWLLIDKGLV